MTTVKRKNNSVLYICDVFTYNYIYICVISRRSITPQHIKYSSKSLDVVQSLYFGSKLPSSVNIYGTHTCVCVIIHDNVTYEGFRVLFIIII